MGSNKSGGYWLDGKWHPTNVIVSQSEPSYVDNVFYSAEGEEDNEKSNLIYTQNVVIGVVLILTGIYIYKNYIK